MGLDMRLSRQPTNNNDNKNVFVHLDTNQYVIRAKTKTNKQNVIQMINLSMFRSLFLFLFLFLSFSGIYCHSFFFGRN